MRKLSLAMLALLAASAAGPAQRGRPGPERAWLLLARKYDRNGDGKITFAEYRRSKETFARLDRNGDGVLTRADFRRGRSPADRRRAVAWALARAADADRNGVVTAAERKAFLSRIVDREGQVTPSSLFRAWPRGNRFVERRVMREVFRGRPSVPVRAVAALLLDLDRDRNGRLDASEVPALRPRRPARSRGPTPRRGERAPDFTLPYAQDPSKVVTLSSFQGKKPVALIFGSYT